jgi:integrase
LRHHQERSARTVATELQRAHGAWGESLDARSDPKTISLENRRRLLGGVLVALMDFTIGEQMTRRGELCALNVGNVDIEHNIIVVRQSRWLRHITSTKSKRPRVFSLSPQLVEKLRPYVEGRPADAPLFVSKRGIQKLEDSLKPVLKQLGLQGGAHAFRHGNATTLDGLGAPMAVRQSRLGHVEAATTMGYTHLGKRRRSLLAANSLPKSCPNAHNAETA